MHKIFVSVTQNEILWGSVSFFPPCKARRVLIRSIIKIKNTRLSFLDCLKWCCYDMLCGDLLMSNLELNVNKRPKNGSFLILHNSFL